MRAQGWLFLLAVILVAKINDVFADVRNLLLLAEFCKHDHGNICLCWATFGKQFCPSGEGSLPMLRKLLSHVGQAPCPKKYIFTLSITYNFIPPTQLWKTLLISCTLSTAKTEIKNPCGYPQAYKQLLENFSTKKEQQKI